MGYSVTDVYWDHVFELGPNGRCEHQVWSKFKQEMRDCGAEKTSVLHDPTHPEDGQRQHWCSILDAGGDCMHMEDFG